MYKVGTVVDRYIVDAVLDESEMSDVYRVRHTWLTSEHALKHLRRNDPELRHALLEEGRLLALLDHPNIVRVTDALELEGRPALVMQLVGDSDLADWIDRWKKPPLDEAVDLFRGVVRGLNAAHQLGIVHRDLKPENVLLQNRFGKLTPKLTDFGLAKVRKRVGPTLSAEYSLIGTPEYMAPEQGRSPGNVDPRADMFSLGAVLYELLTGRIAFEATDPDEAMARVLANDHRPMDDIRPGLHPMLHRCVAGLLKPEPRDRISSCTALLALLDQVPPTSRWDNPPR